MLYTTELKKINTKTDLRKSILLCLYHSFTKELQIEIDLAYSSQKNYKKKNKHPSVSHGENTNK